MSERHEETMARNELHPQVLLAKTFLEGDSGKKFATNIADRTGVISAKDLCGHALYKIWRMFDIDPERQGPKNMEAYCVKVMQNIVRDARTGKDREPYEYEIADDSTEAAYFEATAGRSDEIVDPELSVKLRLLVESGDGDAASKSAVLSYLALTAEPRINCSDLPSPQAGARPDQAMWWPCIYLARRDGDLFPGGRKTQVAQRQALNRAVRGAGKVLDDVRARYALTNGEAA